MRDWVAVGLRSTPGKFLIKILHFQGRGQNIMFGSITPVARSYVAGDYAPVGSRGKGQRAMPPEAESNLKTEQCCALDFTI